MVILLFKYFVVYDKKVIKTGFIISVECRKILRLLKLTIK